MLSIVILEDMQSFLKSQRRFIVY